MKRTKPVHGDGGHAITPSYDQPAYSAALRYELTSLKNLLSAERRRNAQVERILTQRVESQERIIDDLRALYMRTLKIEVGERR